MISASLHHLKLLGIVLKALAALVYGMRFAARAPQAGPAKTKRRDPVEQ